MLKNLSVFDNLDTRKIEHIVEYYDKLNAALPNLRCLNYYDGEVSVMKELISIIGTPDRTKLYISSTLNLLKLITEFFLYLDYKTNYICRLDLVEYIGIGFWGSNSFTEYVNYNSGSSDVFFVYDQICIKIYPFNNTRKYIDLIFHISKNIERMNISEIEKENIFFSIKRINYLCPTSGLFSVLNIGEMFLIKKDFSIAINYIKEQYINPMILGEI